MVSIPFFCHVPRYFVLFLLYTWGACFYGFAILVHPFLIIMGRDQVSTLLPGLGPVGSMVSSTPLHHSNTPPHSVSNSLWSAVFLYAHILG